MAGIPTTYVSGTASINQGETIVTGQGTAWLSSGIQAGDVFWAAGLSVRIASVESNNSLTLAYGWPGANRAAGQYEVRYTADGLRALATSIAVNTAIGSGNLYNFGRLQTAADKLAYSTGDGTWALMDFKSVTRQFIADNFFPVQQGGGAGQSASKINIGADPAGSLKAQVGGLDIGFIWTDRDTPRSLGASGYHRLPSGLIMQWGTYIGTPSSGGFGSIIFPISFLSSDWVGIAFNGDAATQTQMSIQKNRASLSATRFDYQATNPSSGAPITSTIRIDFLAVGH